MDSKPTNHGEDLPETRPLDPVIGEEATVLGGPGSQMGLGVEPLRSGSMIGDCLLERRLGEGGMGTVYAARQEPLGRQVAVKLMREGLASSSARQRFAFEARVLAGLMHPGIAQLYEYGVHDFGGVGIPYYVMELVADARTLIEFADEEELGLEARLELMEEICRAVHFGHTKGIIHRDLKPANILVDSSRKPKVIDFGLARSNDEDDESAVTRSFATAPGALVGTLPYMSSEQLSGRPADVRSVVYSLGVVLYELVCG
ncbi:MAG: serine/threonine protein kinase, partial [Planctomycetes bacterium]|nr:serine/threonine protein kinase [Planctomycetota bacterium]